MAFPSFTADVSSCFLKVARYIVIGDIHEHTLELQELIAQQEGVIYDKSTHTFECSVVDGYETRFLLVGDYLDKGEPGNTEKIIQFIYANRKHFDIVRGNHENTVWRHLNGIDSPDNLANFNAIERLEINPELRAKFEELYSQSKPFLIFNRPDMPLSFIVTHSPCEHRYLGKLDAESISKQMYWKVTDKETTTKYIKELDDAFIPGWRHIFGHVSFDAPFDTGKLIGLDSRASCGNGLSCAIVEPWRNSVQLKHYKK